jgi:ABC-type transporter Mla subunit MlaD
MSAYVDGNMSDKELDDGTAEVERLRDRLRELMDRFEAMKLATLRGVLTPRAAFLNNTTAVLRELRTLDPAAQRDLLISVDKEADIREALRQILEKAPADRAPEDAGRGRDSPSAGQGRGSNSFSI